MSRLTVAPHNPTVAIIGGGFTGATVAAHLASGPALPPGTRIIVVEPRAALGQGLAYGATDPAHRINVPAGKMTMDPERPQDFEDYLQATGAAAHDADLIGRDGLPYPQRAVFGAYMAARLAPLLAAGQVEHWQTRVRALKALASGYRIDGEDGRALTADLVVLAVSHPAPALPRGFEALRGAPKLIADVTLPDALAPIETEDRVLILGNGLTSADAIASLARQGHRGPLLSLSRRGLRSRAHGPAGQAAYGAFADGPRTSASTLLRDIRQTIRQAEREGLTWHAVIDAVRAQGQTIWPGLPMAERRRIVRHLRPFWDVHRFRIAPQVDDVLRRATDAGRLQLLAASVASVDHQDGVYRLQVRDRRSKTLRQVEADAVIVTTGPAHGGILESQPFLADLAREGLLQPCPTGLGIACDQDGHPLAGNGRPVEEVFIAGPLARGTVGELMGLPQVTDHAVFIAAQLRARLLKHRQSSAA